MISRTMVKISHFFFINFILFFALSAQATVTNIVASVDKNPIMLDESLQLIITATGEVDNTDLDLSALDKDFNRRGTSISRSTQMINFNTTKTTTWTTQLLPRETGRFTIPSFTIDGQSTQAFDVLVVPVSSGQGQQARQFYVTAEVDKSEVYLQQQIKYTVKIHMAGDIQRGSLQSPELAGAVIKQLGEDKEYQDLQNGVRYRVIERTFAIIPQSSGTFSINGPLFQGEVLTDSRQGFGFFNRTKSVSRSGPRLEINVKPIPANYTEHWLPSEFVQLNEEWQGNADTFIVGEPITRTLTLTAAGLVEEQLPEITANYPPQFKTYPDQASTATVDQNNILFAQRVENIAVIPNEPGTFVLPEVTVPWFNVLTEQTEIAKLPARSVTVVASSASDIAQTTPLPQSTQQDFEATNPAEEPSVATQAIQSEKLDWLHWVLISVNLLLMAIIAVLILTRSSAKTVSKSRPLVHTHASNEVSAWKSLQDSIAAKRNSRIQSDLLSWLKLASGQSQHSAVGILSSLNAQALVDQFNQLQAAQYAPNGTSSQVDMSEFKNKLSELRQDLLKQTKPSAVQKLYS